MGYFRLDLTAKSHKLLTKQIVILERKFMIRKILMPGCGDGKGGNALAQAAAVARGFNAHIEITTQKSLGVTLPSYR